VKESNFFKLKGEELGATVYIEEADNNESLQYKKALEFIDKDIDVLCLIAVNTNTAAAIVRAAKQKDVKVIAYDRMVKSKDLDLYISGNNKKFGEDMCASVLKIKPKGNYIILSGDKFDRSAIELQQSIDSTLAPHVQSGDIKILYKTFIEEWSGVNAGFELNQFLALSGEKPDVILAAYDGIADGVINVLRKYNMDGNVLITGQDAELEAIKHITEGTQLMTVYHPLEVLGSKAAEIAFRLAQGKMPDKSEISYTNNSIISVPTIKINSIPVLKENIDNVLIKTGVYTSQEIYQ
jgi:D-xylose transport system substrate-binding protein